MAEFAKFRSEIEEDDASLQSSTHKMLTAISERACVTDRQAIVLTTQGVRVARAHKGFLLCEYTVPNGVLGENGNWHAGAIATLIDNIGTFATFSSVPAFNVSVDFSISFFSTAKAQEEVEVEAKVVGNKGKLTCVAVQVRKKENGELIASSKQWMSATNLIAGLGTIINGCGSGSYGGAVKDDYVKHPKLMGQSLGMWTHTHIPSSGLSLSQRERERERDLQRIFG